MLHLHLPPPARQVVVTLYTKLSYALVHDDELSASPLYITESLLDDEIVESTSLLRTTICSRRVNPAK